MAREPRPIGFGCMRLSTEADRDRERACRVLEAALDAGVTLLDTADAYCLDDREVGHNERLIAEVLASRPDRGAGVRIATKGGLVRPRGRWEPNGRAKHLRAAAEASLTALGRDRLDLYLLHAKDPGVPLATSVRALAKLQRDGLASAVGLCNVRVGDIEEARSVTEIAAVQVAINPFDTESFRGGVAEYCVEHGIELIGHSPFGGPKRARRIARDPVLGAIASEHGVTAYEVALAWLIDLAPNVVVIPGTTQTSRAKALASVGGIELTRENRAALDERFPAGALLRTPRSERRPPDEGDGEVVLVMGIPAAGKTTRVRELVERGYQRLNRDELGGRLRDLLAPLDQGLARGGRRFVLDNTYASRSSRNEVIELAWRHGARVRCVWLDTSVPDAQINAVQRMLAAHGRLLEPDEIAAAAKTSANTFAPGVLFRFERDFEPPVEGEGFGDIEVVSFERWRDPSREARAVFLDGPGVLWDPDSGEVRVAPERVRALKHYHDTGWKLLALLWEPGISRGTTTAADLAAKIAEAERQIGCPIDFGFCPHPPGPPKCWCRKPLPGLAVALIEKHGLDPTRCLLVARSAADRTLAERLGFEVIA